MSAMPNFRGSQGQRYSTNVLDNRFPGCVARRPGGGVPNRLDTTISPATELDLALGFAIHDDGDMSIGSPSVATAVTANVSPVTPDVNRPVEDSRGRRARSNGSGHDRQRRHRGNIARRDTSSDSPRLAKGGTIRI
jgi:hypothetical protein